MNKVALCQLLLYVMDIQSDCCAVGTDCLGVLYGTEEGRLICISSLSIRQ